VSPTVTFTDAEDEVIDNTDNVTGKNDDNNAVTLLAFGGVSTLLAIVLNLVKDNNVTRDQVVEVLNAQSKFK